MANYQHKRSAVAGKIPLASDLLDGEIAVNIKDRKLFAKDDQGVIFEFSGGNGGAVDTVNNVAPVNGDVTLNALSIPPTSDRLWLTQAERQLIASFDAYDKVESDDRYLLEANNLSDLDNVSTARTNLGLGTAATRDVGVSAGNLMEVGAFGLGGSASASGGDTNDLPNGFAYVSGINNPGSNAAVITATASNRYGFQLSGRGIIGARLRTVEAGVWTPWRVLYHTGNILGTVSQSGGVPTGAIIERGSNVNGAYTKYADGTLQFSGMGTLSVDNANNGFSTITLPVTPFGNYEVAPSKTSAGLPTYSISRLSKSTNSITVYVWNFYEQQLNTGTCDISYIGYGRWY